MPAVATQYLLFGLSALVVTIVVLWLYNRREARRKHAIELAGMMNQWGLAWFADAYECYAVGDYSGLAHKVREIVAAVRSDEAMMTKLWESTLKVTTYVAESDPTKAAKLLGILQGGKASISVPNTTTPGS